MVIKSAEFVASFAELDQCPKKDVPEIAFIGRSNVGKSSLINMLTRTPLSWLRSRAPREKQNLSIISWSMKNGIWFDLPGYGYAKVSKHERKQFLGRIKHFLDERKQLICTFLLIDSGVPPQKLDLDFANWLGSKEIPFVIVFTKTDKRKNQKNK